MTKPVLSRRSVVRIVLDLIADELASSRGRSALALGASGWTEATRLDESGPTGAGLDLDSLERLGASAALNELFHLHEYGAEDTLLALPTVGEWCDLVEQSLRGTGTHLTFRTSGSTGAPKRCTHAIADLMAEVEAWADMLGTVEQIIALVPSHHIYGTIFTALLPDRLDCPLVRAVGSGGLAQAGPRTVVVGTPTLWAHAARSLLAFPPGITGVSSTAPMSAQLAHRLGGQRLERLIEIYGSTETGGVAWREDAVAPFALLDHWRREAGGDLVRQSADGQAIAHAMMDAGAWIDDRRFALGGRRDGAVQVGGHNVFPARIRQRLLEHAGVADADVRLEPATGRLKAFIVPAAGGDEALIADLDHWCGRQFSDAERPRRFAVGAALPRGPMGKPTDW